MLQAITKNKARKFFEQAGTHTPREDIMTDVVFGGLRYFEPDQAGVALHWLMPDLIEIGSSVLRIDLWPRGKPVEPDVVIDMKRPNGEQRRIIVECKWDNYMLTAKQLAEQWLAYGPKDVEEGDVHHVLVVQRKIRVEPEAFTLAPKALRAVRSLFLWRDLAASANSRRPLQGGQPLNNWIGDVVRVMSITDEKAFNGWSTVPEVDRALNYRFNDGCWDHPRLELEVGSHFETGEW